MTYLSRRFKKEDLAPLDAGSVKWDRGNTVSINLEVPIPSARNPIFDELRRLGLNLDVAVDTSEAEVAMGGDVAEL